MKRVDLGSQSLLWQALLGAAGGAAVGFALWMFSGGEGTLRLGPLELSGDWIQQLKPPLPGWAASIGLGAVIGAIVGAVAEIRGRGRASMMQEVAAELGLAYARKGTDVALAEDGSSLRDALEFGAGTTARMQHCFVGERDGCRLAICDLTESSNSSNSGGGSNSSRRRRTVCLTPIEGLPEFTLAPRNRLHRLTAALGMGGMSFAPGGLTGEDREVAQRFVGAWRMEACEPLATVGSGDTDAVARERSVRQLFTTRLMNALEPWRGWSVSVRRGQLIVWRGKGFVSAKDRAELAATAGKVRTLLDEARRSPGGVEVPEEPGETAAVRARQTIGSVVGGLAGGVIGFFGGFGAFVSLLVASNNLGALEMTLFFVSPLVGAALGGLIGAVFGSRVGRRWRYSPASLPLGQKPGGPWVTGGVMLGFLCGGVIGIGCLGLIDSMVGPNALPVWLVFPMFFACPILGLMAGAIAGGRVQAYRARRIAKSRLQEG